MRPDFEKFRRDLSRMLSDELWTDLLKKQDLRCIQANLKELVNRRVRLVKDLEDLGRAIIAMIDKGHPYDKTTTAI